MSTPDSANVEIYDLVGDSNIFLFGMTDRRCPTIAWANNYYSRAISEENPQIKRVLNAFIDGTILISSRRREIFHSLGSTMMVLPL